MSYSEIYQLQCECRATRQFQTRFNKHKHDFKYGVTDRSKFAAHCLENCHPFSSKSQIFSIVKNINKTDQIDIREVLAISRASQTSILINEQIPDSNNPLFYIN